jgi:hypothetical protein
MKLKHKEDSMPRFALIIAAVLTLAACQSKPENNGETEAAAVEPARETVTERRVVRERSEPAQEETQRPMRDLTDPANTLPQLRGELEQDGYGLEMIIDGSSPAAFQASLELIAAESSAQQYQSFNSALRYLQAYMLGPRNLTEFYQRLDAMTPQEVIELAQQQRRR